MNSKQITIDPRAVITSGRLREVDEDVVAAICAVGLRDDLHPIIVRPVYEGDELRPSGHRLVAGAHRLAAAIHDGRTEISAIEQELDDDQARLVEIEENMVRKGLKGLERARFLTEWKRIYEARHPDTRHGAHGHNKGSNEGGNFPFSKIAARKLECDPSTVKKSITLFKYLTPDVEEMIAGTWIAEKDSELRALAKLDAALQKPVVEALLRPEKPARNVKAALAEVGAAEPEASAEDRQFQKLMDAWNRAGSSARAQFLAALRDAGELSVEEAV